MLTPGNWAQGPGMAVGQTAQGPGARSLGPGARGPGPVDPLGVESQQKRGKGSGGAQMWGAGGAMGILS